MYTGGFDGEHLLRMLDDLGDLFERAAADDTSVTAIVGEDPVEFAEEFKRNYSEGSWYAKEQRRLIDSITQAEQQDGTPHRGDDGRGTR